MDDIFRGNPLVLTGVTVLGHNELGDASLRLDDVSLTLAPGEWLYLVGVNGSGKSTIARLLAGLHTEGADGMMDRGFAGQGASPIVLQQPEAQLFGENPREEIRFALEWRGAAADDIEPFIEQALALTGLTALADEPWERLSGGQKQLAAIAASASLESPLIVLDEATSMLDEANRDAVMGAVEELNRRGTAVVWVTQRLDELEPDARVAAIAEGKISYDGSARAFFYGDAGEGSPESPCADCGLRMPYMAELAIQLRRQGRLRDPLPVTASEWRKVMESDGEAGKG